MNEQNGTLRERLLVEAEAQIDKLLAQGIEDRLHRGEMRLNELDQVVLQSQRDYGQTLTATLLAEAGQATLAPPLCPSCGRTMRSKGRKARHLVTPSGQGQLERSYYYCPACRRGHFPPR